MLIGFHTCTPKLDRPGVAGSGLQMGISLMGQAYFAVMTPCCSIKNKTISLAPLLQIRLAMLKNPYFREDLTRVNDKVAPQNQIPPEEWAKLSPEEQANRIAEGDGYALMDAFVYGADPLLQAYELKIQATQQVPIGHYLLDFGGIFRVDCDLIKREAPAPNGVKWLQLSVPARESLRRKLANYFGRRPAEDERELSL